MAGGGRRSDGGGEKWALKMGIDTISHFLFENMCVLVLRGGLGAGKKI